MNFFNKWKPRNLRVTIYEKAQRNKYYIEMKFSGMIPFEINS